MRLSLLALVLTSLALASGAQAGPLRVATTTPDLASLVRAVGGDEVEVTAFVKSGQDPHFIEARPSFIRVLSRTDLFVHMGLQLESGWVPPLLRNARNPRIQTGASGNLDASRGIPLLGIPKGVIDRSMGDVHGLGNPHYLSDPVNGLRVARALSDRLTRLRPESAERFAQNMQRFEQRLVADLVGEAPLAAHGLPRVAQALRAERLDSLVPPEERGGWLGAMRPHHGQGVVADHDLWPYFAKRFGLEVIAFLEPLPGITPTTKHLAEVAELMRQRHVRVILAASYFSPRYAQKVAAAAGGKVVEMANQVGAREGTDDYLSMIDWNVRIVADALD